MLISSGSFVVTPGIHRFAIWLRIVKSLRIAYWLSCSPQPYPVLPPPSKLKTLYGPTGVAAAAAYIPALILPRNTALAPSILRDVKYANAAFPAPMSASLSIFIRDRKSGYSTGVFISESGNNFVVSLSIGNVTYVPDNDLSSNIDSPTCPI